MTHVDSSKEEAAESCCVHEEATLLWSMMCAGAAL